jgi:uncharacterized protein YjbJ (UPF0337 family)
MVRSLRYWGQRKAVRIQVRAVPAQLTFVKGECPMESNEMAGKWRQLKDDVRSRWGKLTEDDIDRIAGNKDKLIDALQERYGYVWDEARQMVDRYLEEYGDLKARASETLRAVASKDNIQKIGNEVAEFVRRHPLPSLLIGLGIGYLLARRGER